MAVNPALRNKLIAAAGGGVIAIATVLIPNLEGTEYKPYQDVGGVWTVCEGITGPDVKPGKTYTREDCDQLLQKHLKPFVTLVNQVVKVPASDYQKAALVSFSYNVGGRAFRNSSVLRYLNAGESHKACDALRSWVYVDRIRIQGLANRREVEREICNWGSS